MCIVVKGSGVNISVVVQCQWSEMICSIVQFWVKLLDGLAFKPGQRRLTATACRPWHVDRGNVDQDWA